LISKVLRLAKMEMSILLISPIEFSRVKDGVCLMNSIIISSCFKILSRKLFLPLIDEKCSLSCSRDFPIN
jgi:hypothetical protein